MANDTIDKSISNLNRADKDYQDFNEKFNPDWSNPAAGKIPYYTTGARCLIKIAGKQLAICQDFRWSVSYNATPIQTIDTPFAWDIDVGQVNIQATLTKISNPTKGPEAEGIFPIMAAAVHQPMVELQVLYGVPQGLNDVNAKSYSKEPVWLSLFFARGMFVSMSNNATLGQIGQLSANFVGVAYQHYVAQNFTAYGLTAMAQELADGTQDGIKNVTGGFL